MPDTLPNTVPVTAPDTVPDILCLENLRRMTERILDTSNPIEGTKGGRTRDRWREGTVDQLIAPISSQGTTPCRYYNHFFRSELIDLTLLINFWRNSDLFEIKHFSSSNIDQVRAIQRHGKNMNISELVQSILSPLCSIMGHRIII